MCILVMFLLALIWYKRSHFQDMSGRPIEVEMRKSVNPERRNFWFYKLKGISYALLGLLLTLCLTHALAVFNRDTH